MNSSTDLKSSQYTDMLFKLLVNNVQREVVIITISTKTTTRTTTFQ
jgi:hypothetical protein